MTPHKATSDQWKNVGRWSLIEGFSTDSVLLEVADRVAALEAATSPPPAADHSRVTPEMVATDEELSDGYHTFAELYEHRHALFLAFMRAMPQHCWFSLRHADGEKCFGGDDWFIAGAELPGGSSVTYHLPADLYPLAKATGASRLDLGRPWDGHTASDVVSRLMEWAAHPCQEGPPSTPPPALAGGLVESVKAAAMREDWLNNELDQSACDDDDDPTYRYTSAAIDSGHDVCSCQARATIHAVADWLQQRSSTIANGSQWAEMLREEADR